MKAINTEEQVGQTRERMQTELRDYNASRVTMESNLINEHKWINVEIALKNPLEVSLTVVFAAHN